MFTVLLRYFELKAETLGREREKRKKFSEWIELFSRERGCGMAAMTGLHFFFKTYYPAAIFLLNLFSFLKRTEIEIRHVPQRQRVSFLRFFPVSI